MLNRKGEIVRSDNVQCPYCGEVITDSWEYELDDFGADIECIECGKTFKAYAEYDVTYRSHRK